MHTSLEGEGGGTIVILREGREDLHAHIPKGGQGGRGTIVILREGREALHAHIPRGGGRGI